MSDLPTRRDDGRYECHTPEEVTALIQELYPEGLEAHRYSGGLDGGTYIGFNLCRYAYTDRMAAELHAMRDLLNGEGGHSYGCPFKPYVTEHKAEDGTDWYEVYTG